MFLLQYLSKHNRLEKVLFEKKANKNGFLFNTKH